MDLFFGYVCVLRILISVDLNTDLDIFSQVEAHHLIKEIKKSLQTRQTYPKLFFRFLEADCFTCIQFYWRVEMSPLEITNNTTWSRINNQWVNSKSQKQDRAKKSRMIIIIYLTPTATLDCQSSPSRVLAVKHAWHIYTMLAPIWRHFRGKVEVYMQLCKSNVCWSVTQMPEKSTVKSTYLWIL